jgi:hypothetical protein
VSFEAASAESAIDVCMWHFCDIRAAQCNFRSSLRHLTLSRFGLLCEEGLAKPVEMQEELMITEDYIRKIVKGL